MILVLLILGIGFWFFEKAEAPVNGETVSYKNEFLGISFKYPRILEVTEKNKTISVHHEVLFTHHDFCDFKGEVDTTIDIMPDFHLDMYLVSKNLVGTMKQESLYIPEENFVNGAVVLSPGFIDTTEFGTLKGFAIFEGAEGCGQTTYYFVVNGSKTLVVKQKLITIFTGAIDVEQKDKAEAVIGVINKEKESFILNNILESLRVE